ncbi:MAG: polysaccharide biosynthesis PFTS motif protein [Enterobacterales bacterium]|jgi:polysaccharide biosynthesis PFTS motif protein
MIKNYLKKRKNKYIRNLMRGYRNLSQSGKIYKIADLKRQLTISKLKLGFFSDRILSDSLDDYEIVIRQYLLTRFASINLNKAILYGNRKSNGKLVFPLPKLWRDIVEENGLKVAKYRCMLLWQMTLVCYFFYGVLFIFKKIYASLIVCFFYKKSTPENYIYFFSLKENNISVSSDEKNIYNMISWYSNWNGRASSIEVICHDVNVATKSLRGNLSLQYMPSATPPLGSLFEITHFLRWSIGAIFISLFDLLRGRWWHVLLLQESAKSALIRLQKKSLAKEYFFHNSEWIYRPLWTYEAERKGAEITFYFYSTNIEGFKRDENAPHKYHYGYQSMNWPRYLVWNECQADFVRRVNIYIPEIVNVGPIWFEDTSEATILLPPNGVAVFDVQPVRDCFYKMLCIDFDYYIPENCNQFIIDVYAELTEADCNLMLKQKRKLGKLIHPRYKKHINRLNMKSNFIIINAEISPIKIIEKAIAVISMPFTSTALLAKDLGKPSIYYDPFGIIKQDDGASHGIQIVTGRKELKKWVDEVAQKNINH